VTDLLHVYETDGGEIVLCRTCAPRVFGGEDNADDRRRDATMDGSCARCGGTYDDLFEGYCDGIAASLTYDAGFGEE
jgi:hypothetical protein